MADAKVVTMEVEVVQEGAAAQGAVVTLEVALEATMVAVLEVEAVPELVLALQDVALHPRVPVHALIPAALVPKFRHAQTVNSLVPHAIVVLHVGKMENV